MITKLSALREAFFFDKKGKMQATGKITTIALIALLTLVNGGALLSHLPYFSYGCVGLGIIDMGAFVSGKALLFPVKRQGFESRTQRKNASSIEAFKRAKRQICAEVEKEASAVKDFKQASPIDAAFSQCCHLKALEIDQRNALESYFEEMLPGEWVLFFHGDKFYVHAIHALGAWEIERAFPIKPDETNGEGSIVIDSHWKDENVSIQTNFEKGFSKRLPLLKYDAEAKTWVKVFSSLDTVIIIEDHKLNLTYSLKRGMQVLTLKEKKPTSENLSFLESRPWEKYLSEPILPQKVDEGVSKRRKENSSRLF